MRAVFSSWAFVCLGLVSVALPACNACGSDPTPPPTQTQSTPAVLPPLVEGGRPRVDPNLKLRGTVNRPHPDPLELRDAASD